MSVLDILKRGLKKTATGVARSITGLFSGTRTWDAETFEELEYALIAADFGVPAARETVAEARREADEMTARAAREAADAVERCRAELGEDAREIAQQLDKRTEELARAYLSALTGV